jgi:carboxymethylenebutenolidase
MIGTTIQTGHGAMPVYVAAPSGTGPRPGVVIHDAMGMGQDVRNQADRLAAEGFRHPPGGAGDRPRRGLRVIRQTV